MPQNPQDPRFTDPRPSSMKVLATIAIILGIMSIWGPFDLVRQTRGAATQPGSREIMGDSVVFPYIVLSTMIRMLLGLVQVGFAMFALQLRNWARKGLLVSSAMIILALIADLYLTYTHSADLRAKISAATQASGGNPYILSIPNFLWMMCSAGILYVYNQAYVKQIFLIASDVRKRASESSKVASGEGGDVGSSSGR